MCDPLDDYDPGWTDDDPQDGGAAGPMSSSRDPPRAAPVDICKMEVSGSRALRAKCGGLVKSHRSRGGSPTRVWPPARRRAGPGRDLRLLRGVDAAPRLAAASAAAKADGGVTTGEPGYRVGELLTGDFNRRYSLDRIGMAWYGMVR